MKIHTSRDRVKLTVGEVGFVISPLSYGQKLETSLFISNSGGKVVTKLSKMTFYIIKNCVKEIHGVEDSSGKPYKLEFEDKEFSTVDGEMESTKVLTDQCARDLMSGLMLKPSLNDFSYQLLNGIPEEIVDHEGKKMRGVKIEPLGKPRSSKKK